MAAFWIILGLGLLSVSSAFGAVLQCDFDTAEPMSTVFSCKCDNDDDACELKQVVVNDEFQWTANKGSTGTTGTGPDDDHTRGNGTGLYIYAEASDIEPGTTAQIQTASLSLSQPSCLTFWYHMYSADNSDHLGKLQLFLTFSNGSNIVKWERSGSEGDNSMNQWRGDQHVLGTDVTRVSFRTTRGGTDSSQPYGDIALDDIAIEGKVCDTDRTATVTSTQAPEPMTQAPEPMTQAPEPMTQAPEPMTQAPEPMTQAPEPMTQAPEPMTQAPEPMTQAPEPMTPAPEPMTPAPGSMTPAPGSTISGLQCDFDTAQSESTVLPCVCDNIPCNLEHVDVTEPFQWRIYRGSTPSSETGPDNDHTRGDNTGLYIYTEASNVEPDTTAQIKTPALDHVEPSCLTFWYHMYSRYSSGMGTLKIMVAGTSVDSSILWQRSASQGSSWLKENVTLPKDTIGVTFQAIRGPDYRSDIALDDIMITPGACRGTPSTVTTTATAITPASDVTVTTTNIMTDPSTTTTVATPTPTTTETPTPTTTTRKISSVPPATPTTPRSPPTSTTTRATPTPTVTTAGVTPSPSTTAEKPITTTVTTIPPGVSESTSPEDDRPTVTIATSVVVVALLGIAAAVVIVIMLRRRRENKDPCGNVLSPEDRSDSKMSLEIDNDDKPGITIIPTHGPVLNTLPIPPPSPKPQPSPKPVVPPKPKAAIKAEELEDYVARRKANLPDFHDEYLCLPGDDAGEITVGMLPDNIKKNRFKDIIAFDSSRVILEGDSTSDYINASYINGYGEAFRAYIATQGPKPTTVADLWQMIWQEGCNRIVMLANLVEKGKQRVTPYWPEELDTTEDFGDISVTFESEDVCLHYTTRIFRAQMMGQRPRRIYQYHFTTWPDKERTQYGASTLISFRRHVHGLGNQSTGPLVVHCSAGVGRTGTFIAYDILYRQLKEEKQVQIYGCLEKLRPQRMKLVQTPDQYVFLHDMLAEVVRLRDISYPSQRIEQTYRTITQTPKGARQSEVKRQFKLLCELRVFPSNADKVGLQAINRNKNRDLMIIPSDNDMPYLSTPYENGNSYINAVFVDSYRRHNHYIVTQIPLSNTVVDFWRLVHDHKVNTVVLLNELDTHESMYWPEEVGVSQEYGPLTVKMTQSGDLKEDIIYKDITVNKTDAQDDSRAIRLRLIQFMGWTNDKDLPPRIDAIPDLIGFVNNWRQMNRNNNSTTNRANDRKVIVQCLNGRGPSGMYCATSYTLEQVQAELEVDVFTAARYMSSRRPEFFKSVNEYQYVYQVVVHCQTARSNEYANFENPDL